MKNNFLKNIPILIVYLGFLIYLVFGVSFLNLSHNVSDLIGKLSPILLILILMQIYLWRSNKKLNIHKLILIITLLIINAYLLFNYHLSRILVNDFNIENIGIIINLLAMVAGFILLVETLLLVIYFFRTNLSK